MNLNLENIDFNNKNINYDFLKNNFDESIINDFNNKNFNNKNINSIIEISLYLKIDNLNEFLFRNLKPSKYIYLIDSKYYKIINISRHFIQFDSPIHMKKLRKSRSLGKINILTGCECIKLNLTNWIKFILNNNKDLYYIINTQLINTCSKYNNLECLKLIHTYLGDKIEWNITTINMSAKYNNVEILKYLIDNGCTSNKLTIKYIIENKNYDLLEYITNKVNKFIILSPEVSDYIIKSNEIKLLKYFYNIGGKFNYDAYELIAEIGNLECLKFLLEKKLFYEKDFAAKILYDNCQDDFIEKYFNPNLEKMCLIYIKNNNLVCLKKYVIIIK